MAQAALRLQRLHQLFERQVLVVLSLQRTLFDLGQQLTERHLPIHISLDHLGIDEEADQALSLATVSVGVRHTHTDIGLTAVAIQQGLERSQQQHEQGYALALRQGLEAGGQCRLQHNIMACAPVTLPGWPRMIQRQLQHRLRATQLLAPISKLTRFLSGFHPAALPQGIVGILDRQRRQLTLKALAERSVELHQFLHHDPH
ncbi:hypothetical protein PFL603g_06223 [Pseudomonas fluorescens]|uniref:Uncharacterized protein n=1 Tax=Pseudomonas fluorescens TaxID=294 RepID=A0A120FWD4_PSEFL|nr:hypothetical protein PFL603g_06223 [Pseudomonas fluorescens]